MNSRASNTTLAVDSIEHTMNVLHYSDRIALYALVTSFPQLRNSTVFALVLFKA